MTPSHRLKLDRAYEHLVEIETLLKPLRERREYPVIETMKPDQKGALWDYTLDLDGIKLPERLPILMGDYLFNMRSALDHLAVALGPRKHRRKLSFPILTKDPLARDKISGDYLDRNGARRWLAMCCHLPDHCIAPLTVLQPYQAAAIHGHRGDRHALALLSSFQNADKHRELVEAEIGLTKSEVLYDDELVYAVPTFKNGTQLMVNSPRPMQVKIKGVAIVGIRRGKEVWSFDLLTDKLGDFIVNELLPRLEQCL